MEDSTITMQSSWTHPHKGEIHLDDLRSEVMNKQKDGGTYDQGNCLFWL